jgi:hypothetical protein
MYLIDKDREDPRRRTLIQLLGAGMLGAASPAALAQVANIFGSKPARLPAGQSIYRISGGATVNDKPADLNTKVNPGDTIKTGKDSELVFVINTQAMILRANSNVVIEAEKKADSVVVSGLRMLTGALLSVSRNQPMRLRTPTATVGIRGTGFYVEAEPEQTYFCTCYGVTEIASNAQPEKKETITATMHDRPVFIGVDAKKGSTIQNAPFINHTDLELAMIEALVGRTPSYVFGKDTYTAPRRNY